MPFNKQLIIETEQSWLHKIKSISHDVAPTNKDKNTKFDKYWNDIQYSK